MVAGWCFPACFVRLTRVHRSDPLAVPIRASACAFTIKGAATQDPGYLALLQWDVTTLLIAPAFYIAGMDVMVTGH